MSTTSKTSKAAHRDAVPAGEIDPAVIKVHRTLEASLSTFMVTVGELCRTWDANLRTAMPFNPKAKFFTDDAATAAPGSPDAPRPASPLVKRAVAAEPVAAPPAASASKATKKKEKPAAISTSAEAAKPDKKKDAKGEDDEDEEDEEEEEDPTELQPQQRELLKQLRILKTEARNFTKVIDHIHDWIALNVPAISGEEGDDGGVEVMGVVISNVEEATEALQGVYELESKYLDSRIEVESAVRRHSECPSVMAQIATLDSDTWDDVERGWRSMIRTALLLHTQLAKNMTVLRDPRKQRTSVHL